MVFYEVLLSKAQNVALAVTVGGFVTVGVFGIACHTIVKTCVCCEIHEDKEVNIRIEVGEAPVLHPGCSCQRGDWVSTLGLRRASTK